MERRRLIGIIAVGLLAGGLLQLWLQPDGYTWEPVAAACLRVGVMLFALWLAYPDLRRIPAWMWGGLVTSIVVVAWRPRLAILVVPILALLWTLRRWTRSGTRIPPAGAESRRPGDPT